MKKEDKKRDPMPPPDATPEEIGEFWDTHDLTDYWDETQEVEIQVDLKSERNRVQSDEAKPDLSETTEDAGNAELDIVPKDTTGKALDVVTNFISGLDPSTWLARNASKALGQLSSAAIKWPVAYFEGKAAETRAGTEARLKIIKTNADQIAQQLEVNPEYVRRAGNKFAEKIIREQINLDNISAIAANELREDEPNSSADKKTNEPNEGQSADSSDSSNQVADSGEKKVINDDWLNGFETEARQKSTEEMQLRFGHILAGEIRQPGSYSIKAVKLLSELEQDTAALFKKFCSACVVVGTLGIPSGERVFDARVLSLGDSLGSNTLSKYGLGLNQLNILNEYSLITSGDIPLYDYNLVSLYDYNLCIEYEDNPVPLPFQHQGKYWILSPTSERDNNPEFRLSGVMLSRIGCELFRIVDQDPMPDYTEDLKKYFASQKLQMLEVQNQ